jgi:hypothetical protein
MAARFWIGGTGNWDGVDTTHWATTSGGTGGASAPGSSDDVTFDASSGGGVVTVTAPINVLSLTGGAHTGTFDFNGQSATIGTFNWGGSGTRTLKLSSSAINITGAAGNRFAINSASGLTMSANTAVVTLSGGGSLQSATLNYNGTSFVFTGAGTPSITGSGNPTIKNLTRTGGDFSITRSTTFDSFTYQSEAAARALTITAGITLTLTAAAGWLVNGSSGKLITISSTVGGSVWNLSCSSGTVSSNYLSLQDSAAAGGATFLAGSNSVNVSGNSGWVFATPKSSGGMQSKRSLLNLQRL